MTARHGRSPAQARSTTIQRASVAETAPDSVSITVTSPAGPAATISSKPPPFTSMLDGVKSSPALRGRASRARQGHRIHATTRLRVPLERAATSMLIRLRLGGELPRNYPLRKRSGAPVSVEDGEHVVVAEAAIWSLPGAERAAHHGGMRAGLADPAVTIAVIGSRSRAEVEVVQITRSQAEPSRRQEDGSPDRQRRDVSAASARFADTANGKRPDAARKELACLQAGRWIKSARRSRTGVSSATPSPHEDATE